MILLFAHLCNLHKYKDYEHINNFVEVPKDALFSVKFLHMLYNLLLFDILMYSFHYRMIYFVIFQGEKKKKDNLKKKSHKFNNIIEKVIFQHFSQRKVFICTTFVK